MAEFDDDGFDMTAMLNNHNSGGEHDGGEHSGSNVDDIIDESNAVYATQRDAILFMIDCKSSMFKMDSEKNNDTSPFRNALRSVREIYQEKIVQSPRDLVGLVLYNTREANNVFNFRNVYMFHPLDTPSAYRVLELSSLANAGRIGTDDHISFEQYIGFGDKIKMSVSAATSKSKSNQQHKNGHQSTVGPASSVSSSASSRNDSSSSVTLHVPGDNPNAKLSLAESLWAAQHIYGAVASSLERGRANSARCHQQHQHQGSGSSSSGASSSSRPVLAFKRIFLFTDDEDPTRGDVVEQTRCLARIKDLCGSRIGLHVYAHGIDATQSFVQNGTTARSSSSSDCGNAINTSTSDVSFNDTASSSSSSSMMDGRPTTMMMMMKPKMVMNPGGVGAAATSSTRESLVQQSCSTSVRSTSTATSLLGPFQSENNNNNNKSNNNNRTYRNNDATTSSSSTARNTSNSRCEDSFTTTTTAAAEALERDVRIVATLMRFNPYKFWSKLILEAIDFQRQQQQQQRAAFYLSTTSSVPLKTTTDSKGNVIIDNGLGLRNELIKEIMHPSVPAALAQESDYEITVHNTVTSYLDFVSFIRRKCHPKRSLGTLRFIVGRRDSAAPACVVSVFAPLLSCPKPHPEWLERDTNYSCVSETTLESTAHLPAASGTAGVSLGGDNSSSNGGTGEATRAPLRLNQVLRVLRLGAGPGGSGSGGTRIAFTSDDTRKIRLLSAPEGSGVTILGFIPASAFPVAKFSMQKCPFLHIHQTWNNTHGRSFFACLWRALVDKDFVAIAEIVPKGGALTSTRMCCLIPTTPQNSLPEAFAAGSGFHVKVLPYDEDYRGDLLEICLQLQQEAADANEKNLLSTALGNARGRRRSEHNNGGDTDTEDDDVIDDDSIDDDEDNNNTTTAGNRQHQDQNEAAAAARRLVQAQRKNDEANGVLALETFVKRNFLKENDAHSQKELVEYRKKGRRVNAPLTFETLFTSLANPAVQRAMTLIQYLSVGDAILDTDSDSGDDDDDGDDVDRERTDNKNNKKKPKDRVNTADFSFKDRGFSKKQLQALGALKDLGKIPEEYNPSVVLATTSSSSSGTARAAKPPPTNDELAELDFPKLQREGKIQTLLVPVLKAYLKMNGLSSEGLKAELVRRVSEYLQGKADREAGQRRQRDELL